MNEQQSIDEKEGGDLSQSLEGWFEEIKGLSIIFNCNVTNVQVLCFL